MIGPLADPRRDTLGPRAFDFDLDETVTVLEGIRSRVGSGPTIGFAPGIRPARRAFSSPFDTFPGNAPTDPGEAFDDDDEFRRAVDLAAAADVAVVVVGESQDMIGTQGGAAVANLIFGDVSPGGKLSFSWPRAVGQVPIIYSHTISHEPANQPKR